MHPADAGLHEIHEDEDAGFMKFIRRASTQRLRRDARIAEGINPDLSDNSWSSADENELDDDDDDDDEKNNDDDGKEEDDDGNDANPNSFALNFYEHAPNEASKVVDEYLAKFRRERRTNGSDADSDDDNDDSSSSSSSSDSEIEATKGAASSDDEEEEGEDWSDAEKLLKAQERGLQPGALMQTTTANPVSAEEGADDDTNGNGHKGESSPPAAAAAAAVAAAPSTAPVSDENLRRFENFLRLQKQRQQQKQKQQQQQDEEEEELEQFQGDDQEAGSELELLRSLSMNEPGKVTNSHSQAAACSFSEAISVTKPKKSASSRSSRRRMSDAYSAVVRRMSGK